MCSRFLAQYLWKYLLSLNISRFWIFHISGNPSSSICFFVLSPVLSHTFLSFHLWLLAFSTYHRWLITTGRVFPNVAVKLAMCACWAFSTLYPRSPLHHSVYSHDENQLCCSHHDMSKTTNVYRAPTLLLCIKYWRRDSEIEDKVLVFKSLGLVGGGGEDTQGSLTQNMGSWQLTGDFSVGIKSFEAKDKKPLAFQAVVTTYTSTHNCWKVLCVFGGWESWFIGFLGITQGRCWPTAQRLVLGEDQMPVVWVGGNERKEKMEGSRVFPVVYFDTSQKGPQRWMFALLYTLASGTEGGI